MTPYDKKVTEGAIKTLNTIIKESKEKRECLENNLIAEARQDYTQRPSQKNPAYAPALMNSINVESMIIKQMETQVLALKDKLK